MNQSFEARKFQLEKMVAKNGYDQEKVPPLYQEAMDTLPERIEEIKKYASLLPEEFNLSSGEEKIALDQATVVDLGSGPGIVTREIKDKVGRVIAIDQAPKMVSFLKKQFEDSANVEAAVGDMARMPLADNSVEGVISVGTIFELHSEDSENDFLRETMRVLKPGGVLVLDGISNEKFDKVRNNFAQERQKELEAAKSHKGPVTQRFNIFRADELENRLKGLGLDCRVEPFFQEEAGEYCVVRITKLN